MYNKLNKNCSSGLCPRVHTFSRPSSATLCPWCGTFCGKGCDSYSTEQQWGLWAMEVFSESSLHHPSMWLLLNADVSGMFLLIEPAWEVQEEICSCQVSNPCLSFLFKPLNNLAAFLSFREEPLRRIEDKVKIGSLPALLSGVLPHLTSTQSPFPKGKLPATR